MPKTILVVDDSTDTRELLHFYFKSAGFDVIVAADGGEGLYRARADRPDLIVTDINMPNLDGIGMIRQLREEADFADLPIIAVTAYGDEFARQAVEAGATAAAAKPMNLDSLVEQVKGLLGESQ